MSDIQLSNEELIRELFNGYDDLDDEDRGTYYQYLEELRERITKLKTALQEVATLTVGHDVLDDRAVVYPRDLGEILERYDPEWYRTLVKVRE